MLFTLAQIGKQDMRPLLEHLKNALDTGTPSLPELERVVIIRGENPAPEKFMEYNSVIEGGSEVPMSKIDQLTNTVDSRRACNLQFTSGTTGSPKGAQLTHQ